MTDSIHLSDGQILVSFEQDPKSSRDKKEMLEIAQRVHDTRLSICPSFPLCNNSDTVLVEFLWYSPMSNNIIILLE